MIRTLALICMTAPALATAAHADAADNLAETDCDPPALRRVFAGVVQALGGDLAS
ncbi:hypothetical protein [Paracoccus sediminilitoris]|uniref:hypothetical protein n=1 Tax=Paracoccus sediminilitoris TaxID=2202419 RepID=UPI001314496D|nr:hypothetical protein [Paracoccus sediminilitoris]